MQCVSLFHQAECMPSCRWPCCLLPGAGLELVLSHIALVELAPILELCSVEEGDAAAQAAALLQEGKGGAQAIGEALALLSGATQSLRAALVEQALGRDAAAAAAEVRREEDQAEEEGVAGGSSAAAAAAPGSCEMEEEGPASLGAAAAAAAAAAAEPAAGTPAPGAAAADAEDEPPPYVKLRLRW